MKKTVLLTVVLALFSAPVFAETKEFELTIKDHKFSPEKLEIPAGQKVKLLVKNLDATPAEFESTDLNREKIISGNSQAIVFIGPLEVGEYVFFDEFNPKTANGKIVAK